MKIRIDTQDIDLLRNRNLKDLIKESWRIRKENFPPVLTVSTPSQKTYISKFHKNKSNAFVNISVTGSNCALNCEHCKKSLLESMIPILNANELKTLGDKLIKKGCEGVLISGGSLPSGEVPLDNFLDAFLYLKKKGLKVIVHTGLASENTAIVLKKAGVDQVLFDIIGDENTINKVYNLKKTPDDFFRSLKIMANKGLDVVPHILIGLNYGRICGEYNALKMLTQIQTNNIILVVISPVKGTPMENIIIPSFKEIGKIAAIARILNQNTYITLGCARPKGEEKELIEKSAVNAGINGIAYPSDETIEYAKSLGLEIKFKDTCCSLI